MAITPDGTAAEAASQQGTRTSRVGRRSPWAILLQKAVKRSLDVLLSALILVVMIPVVAVVALAILVESRGPLIYRAERVGRGGRAFRMLKFRKMEPCSGGLPLTTHNDARFTRVGAFLVRSKLDELPQLLNVLRGDMSLIGPRPEDQRFVDRRQSDYDVIPAGPTRDHGLRPARVRRRKAGFCPRRIRSDTTSTASSRRNARSIDCTFAPRASGRTCAFCSGPSSRSCSSAASRFTGRQDG